MMNIEFTSHNIRLDNDTFTKPDEKYSMEHYPSVISTKRMLEAIFPGDKSRYRLADLGCLEGGYAVEYARMGFNVVGLEVRSSNIAACQHVKANVDLPNLEFIQDNVWNIAKYGSFDVIFCKGLLYHLDKPKEFLEILSSITSKLLIIQTLFSTDPVHLLDRFPRLIRYKLAQILKIPPDKMTNMVRYSLSPITENESLKGRWYTEFKSKKSISRREVNKWASWDNQRSFWPQREYLLQAIQNVGFNLVLEQYDNLGSDIAKSMLKGFYRTNSRGIFIGIKT
jgi:hypothetical protein